MAKSLTHHDTCAAYALNRAPLTTNGPRRSVARGHATLNDATHVNKVTGDRVSAGASTRDHAARSLSHAERSVNYASAGISVPRHASNCAGCIGTGEA